MSNPADADSQRQTGLYGAISGRAVPAYRSLGIEAVEETRDLDRSAYLMLDEGHGFSRLAETDLLYLRATGTAVTPPALNRG